MKSGLYKTLDWLVLAVCVLFYVTLFVLLVSPVGKSFFDMFKNWMPFIEMVEGTLGDINKFFGLIFQKIGLDGLLAGETFQNAAEFSVLILLQDLSKLLLGSALQSLLFWFFSIVFLRAKGFGPAWLQFIGSGLYAVNHFLLMGISLLVGSFGGIVLIRLFSLAIGGLEEKQQVLISLLVFIFLYILFSIYFCLKAKWADKMNSMRTSVAYAAISMAANAFSFTRSLVKTLLCNVLPEMLKNYVTNTIIVFVFTCIITNGIHIFSVFALFAFFGWCLIENAITGLFAKLVAMPLPFCGKNCPFSGLLWLPATVSMMVFMAVGGVITELDPDTLDFQRAMLHVPFAVEWEMGLQPWFLVETGASGLFRDFIHLFLLCSFMSLLQYLSSSFLPTLFTQVIGRIMIIMGLMLVFAALANLFGTILVDYVIAYFQYKYILGFLLVLAIVLMCILQPYVMLQGLASSICLFLVFQFTAKYAAGLAENTDRELGFLAIVIGINLLFSLLQNIVAVFEKNLNKRKLVKAAGAVTQFFTPGSF